MRPSWRQKSGGKPPQAPSEGALPTDQINLADEESRIVPVAGGGFEQCYNAQAVVAASSLLVIAAQVVQAPNDKQQIEPLLKRIEALPAELGKPTTLLADTGYFSEVNVMLCAAALIDPMIAQGRQSHYPPLSELMQARRKLTLCRMRGARFDDCGLMPRLCNGVPSNLDFLSQRAHLPSHAATCKTREQRS